MKPASSFACRFICCTVCLVNNVICSTYSFSQRTELFHFSFLATHYSYVHEPYFNMSLDITTNLRIVVIGKGERVVPGTLVESRKYPLV